MKKKLWLWDYKGPGGVIHKSVVYLDEHGNCSDGKPMVRDVRNLLKKHEDEYIEIERTEEVDGV